MALIPRSFSIRTGWRDLRGFLSQKHDHGLLFAALSVGLAGLVMTALLFQFSGRRGYVEPEVTYVKQWPSSRTPEEVRAQQLKDAPAERAARKAEEDFKRERQEQFKRADEVLKSIGVGS